MPLAPGRFSTTMVTPCARPICSAIRRATASVLAPGGTGTTSRMVLPDCDDAPWPGQRQHDKAQQTARQISDRGHAHVPRSIGGSRPACDIAAVGARRAHGSRQRAAISSPAAACLLCGWRASAARRTSPAATAGRPRAAGDPRPRRSCRLADWPSARRRNVSRSPFQTSSSTDIRWLKLVRAWPRPVLRRRTASSLPRRWGMDTTSGAVIAAPRRPRWFRSSAMLRRFARHITSKASPSNGTAPTTPSSATLTSIRAIRWRGAPSSRASRTM